MLVAFQLCSLILLVPCSCVSDSASCCFVVSATLLSRCAVAFFCVLSQYSAKELLKVSTQISEFDSPGIAGKPNWHPLSQLSPKEQQWQLQADHLEECADEQQRQHLLYMREACAKRHLFQCKVWPDDHISVKQQLLLTSL